MRESIWTLIKKHHFSLKNFHTLTNLLQKHIVMQLQIFIFLDYLGLVNRGKCPYTGQRINSFSPSWTFMGTRSIYVSSEGHAIMKKEAAEESKRILDEFRKNI